MPNEGEWFDATVSGQSTVLPWLIVILIDDPGSRRKQPLIILPDSLPPDERCVLRAWLRWKLI